MCILHILDVKEELYPITEARWEKLKAAANDWLEIGAKNKESDVSLALRRKSFSANDKFHKACYAVCVTVLYIPYLVSLTLNLHHLRLIFECC